MGEQKYKTNPLKADTNGDGQNDWHEDADHDGQPNGMEQDKFSLPSDLKPTLAKATGDDARLVQPQMPPGQRPEQAHQLFLRSIVRVRW